MTAGVQMFSLRNFKNKAKLVSDFCTRLPAVRFILPMSREETLCNPIPKCLAQVTFSPQMRRNMARRRQGYFYRAFFKPDQLDLLGQLDAQIGVDGRWLGYAQAWHKVNWEHSPHCVINEFVCGEIGRFLRLPIPPFAITSFDSDGHSRVFSSLDFNFERHRLPPVLPDVCAERLPDLCSGILVFDVLIANSDRHDSNLLSNSVDRPTQLIVFDHDQALLGNQLGGIQRLSELKDRMGITGGTVSNGNRHCLLGELQTSKYLDARIDRVKWIPEWYVRDICHTAVNDGIATGALAEAVLEFLLHRIRNIDALIYRNRSHFDRIDDWRDHQWTLPLR